MSSHETLRNRLVVLGVIALVLAQVELGARLHLAYTGGADFWTLTRSDPRLQYRLRSDTQVRFAGQTTRLDARGLRAALVEDSDVPQVDAIRILTVGSSRAFGVGSTYELTYTARLGGALAERLPDQRYELLNGGVVGYSSLQGRLYVHDLLPRLRPHWVIIDFGDMADRMLHPVPDTEVDFYRSHDRPFELAGHNVMSLFLLHQLLNTRFFQVPEQFDAPPKERLDTLSPRVDAERYAADLVEMIELIRLHGAQPLVLLPFDSPHHSRPLYEAELAYEAGDMERCANVARTAVAQGRGEYLLFSYLWQCDNDPAESFPVESFRQAMSNYMNRVARTGRSYRDQAFTVCRETGVPCVDASAELRGHPEWFYDMTLPTWEGHEVIAEVLADAIAPVSSVHAPGADESPVGAVSRREAARGPEG